MRLLLNNDLCVGALASRLNISRAAASQHLQTLRKAGFVQGEKRGYWTHYFVNKETIRDLARQLLEMIDREPLGGLTCIKTLPEKKSIRKGKVITMCCNDCCQQPDKLKGTPQECSPEQIRECHGDVEKHPCADKKRDQHIIAGVKEKT